MLQLLIAIQITHSGVWTVRLRQIAFSEIVAITYQHLGFIVLLFPQHGWINLIQSLHRAKGSYIIIWLTHRVNILAKSCYCTFSSRLREFFGRSTDRVTTISINIRTDRLVLPIELIMTLFINWWLLHHFKLLKMKCNRLQLNTY